MTDRELTLSDAGIDERMGRCPCCYENRFDYLVWDDQNMLHCGTCGNVYDPLYPER